MKKATLLLFIISTLLACKEKKLSNYSYSAESVIEIKTTPCFGKCPVYEMTIDGLGNASYMGKTFAKKEGAYKKRFYSQETNAIFKAFENAEFFNYKDEYSGDMTDLPSTFLTFKHRGKDKKIKLRYGFPDELKALSAMTKKYANTKGWMKADMKN